MEARTPLLRDKVVLVTGGSGSFGKLFVNTVVRDGAPRKLIVFSRDELKQFDMRQTFSEQHQVDGRRFTEAATVTGPNEKEPANKVSFWENGDFGFGDLLDIINPLQHLPIVATVYRNMTGDRLGIAPRVIGGALWGRIGGLVAGLVNSVVEWFTGKDIGDHIYAFFFGKPETTINNAEIASETGARSGVKTSALQKSKNEPPGRRALPHPVDVSKPVTTSVEYESQLSSCPAMTELALRGTRRYQNFHHGHIDERHRAPKHRIQLTA
jgi:NAD(P)-dependent dehydrogenase (short-subunit alcohol dehydrogenase family)